MGSKRFVSLHQQIFQPTPTAFILRQYRPGEVLKFARLNEEITLRFIGTSPINGAHMKVVSERRGYPSIGITTDLYSHVLPGMQNKAAERVDNALRAALNNGFKIT